MSFRRQEREESHARGHWGLLEHFEILAAIASLFVVVAAAFVVILVDTWLGIALAAIAAAAYFVLAFLHIGASRRRVSAQLAEFERRKGNSSCSGRY